MYETQKFIKEKNRLHDLEVWLNGRVFEQHGEGPGFNLWALPIRKKGGKKKNEVYRSISLYDRAGTISGLVIIWMHFLIQWSTEQLTFFCREETGLSFVIHSKFYSYYSLALEENMRRGKIKKLHPKGCLNRPE